MKLTRIISRGASTLLLVLPCLAFADEFGQINGFVKDASDGERLPYANVMVKGTELGAVSDERGYYLIGNVPSGKHVVVVSYVGYKESYRDAVIGPGRTLRCDFELEPSPIQMEGIEVSAERVRFEKDVVVSAHTLREKELGKAPLVGEKDLFRSIQLLPGVIASSDFSSQLYVRGGSPDQNLVLLDGITVYNPSHLGGLFSTFNVDAVSNAELLSGGFPAKYGGRLSSVLDITCKDGNSKKFAGSSNISIISAKTLLEGPLPRGSWMLSGRRTYFDWLLKGTRFSFPYYFYDGMAKVNLDLTDNSTVALTGLLGEDVLDFGIEEEGEEFGHLDMRWGNRGLSGRWRQVFSPRLYGEGLGAWSDFRTTINLEIVGSGIRLNNEIADYSFKGDFTYIRTPKHTSEFGFDAKSLFFDFEVEVDTFKLLDDEETAEVLALYFQDKWEVSPRFLLQAGVRPTYFSRGRRLRWDPRAGLKYRLTPNTAINASLGSYSQFLTTVSSGEELISIFDVWLPVSEDQGPSSATHFILGLERWFSNDLRFTAEGYYKKFDHLLELSQEEGPPEDGLASFQSGSGYATGLDFLLKKTVGRFSGWVSYSLGLTKRTFGDETYCPRYDRRHNLNVVSGMDILWGLRFDVKWSLGAGFPYPGVIGRYPKTEYDFSGDSLVTRWGYIRSPRDYYRYPPYHRLDVGLVKGFSWKFLQGEAFLQLMNLYNRKNVFLYVWDLEEDPPVRRAVTMFPLLPSIGFNIRF